MIKLLLKATDRCNARCAYCVSIDRDGLGRRMDDDALRDLFRWIGDFIAAYPQERVEILWHGGEPLLLGAKFFRTALDIQNRALGESAPRLTHAVQSNLTALTDDCLDSLVALGVRCVGTSYDPNPGVRGIGKAIDSQRYNASFLRAIGLLERRGIAWTVIHVVTRRSLPNPARLLDFLSNLATGGVSFVPMLDDGMIGSDLSITPAEYAAFLGESFRRWWPYRARYGGVQPFDAVCRAVFDGETDEACMEFGVCEPRTDQIEVVPGGAVRAKASPGAGGSRVLGEVATLPLAEALALHRRSLAPPGRQCAGCRLDAWCHPRAIGRQADDGAIAIRPSEWCEARTLFMTKHFAAVTGAAHGPRTH